jgi:hypothetical protein
MKKITSIWMLLTAILAFSPIGAVEISTPQVFAEEFQLSQLEKEDIEKFLDTIKNSENPGLNATVDAALNGNPIAMYLTGYCSLWGTQTSINREVAKLYFAKAASLGYAPALHEISQMYVNEHRDLLLGLVYLNLTISFGHKEYRDLYYQTTKSLSEITGKKVIQEIERLSLKKYIKILEIRSDMENRKDTYKPALVFLTIDADDKFYDRNYWKQFFETTELWEHFFEIGNNKHL